MTASPRVTLPLMSYRPEIDGLRAIAVLVVVFSHARLGCPGGFVGVDVFFVISGYLITSLILRDLEAGEFRAMDFWERRVRRIAPALIVTVTAVFVVGWFLYLPWDFERLGQAMMAQSVCASNIVHWTMSGYFAPDADTLPLLHTWSLAVEEQFYIVFPIVLWLMRSWRRSRVQMLLALACAVSFAVGVWATRKYPGASFYLLPSRAWELLLGSLLASVPLGAIWQGRYFREAASGAGLFAIAASTIWMTSETPFPGVAALIPTLGTVAFIAANSRGLTLGGRILSWRPVVFIGQISYSLYLLHWPLIVFFQYRYFHETSRLGMLGVLALSLLGAILSWRFVETPLRKKRILKSRPALLAATGAALLLLLLTGFWVVKSDGFPTRFTPQQLIYTIPPESDALPTVEIDEIKHGYLTSLGVSQGSLSCLVWGDSHAKSLLPGIDAACRESGIRGAAAWHGGTAPLLEYVSVGKYAIQDSPRFNADVLRYAVKQKVRVVILAALWSRYAVSPDFQQSLKSTVQELVSHGIHVVLVRDVPKQVGNIPRILTHATLMGQDIQAIGVPLAKHRQRNAIADRDFDQLQGEHVTVLDPTPLLTDDKDLCRAALDGVALYVDDNHLSPAGSLRLQPLFQSLIVEHLSGTLP